MFINYYLQADCARVAKQGVRNKKKCELVVLVRPRGGHFVYSDEEVCN